MIYTPEEIIYKGWRNLEVKLSLLIIPLVFFTTQTLTKKEINTILVVFVASCLLTSFTAIQIAVLKNYQTNHFQTILWELYSNQLLARPVGMHASYFSWYIAFAVGISTNFLRINYWKLTLIDKILLYLIIAYLLLFLSLLGAKMIMISFVASFSLISFYYAYQSKVLIKTFFYATILAIVFITIFLANPANLDRLKKAINYKGQYAEEGHFDHSGTKMRWDIWKCTIELIQQKPLLGYGTGEAQKDLNQCYEEKKFEAILYWKRLENGNFNSHNEFFQTTLAIGLVGFVCLCSLTSYLFYQSIISQNILFIFFLLLTLGLMLVEAIFKTQAGVMFFAFFCSILYQYSD